MIIAYLINWNNYQFKFSLTASNTISKRRRMMIIIATINTKIQGAGPAEPDTGPTNEQKEIKKWMVSDEGQAVFGQDEGNRRYTVRVAVRSG